MRIWYVVGDVEYWLEPEYQVNNRGLIRVLGCKLYDPKGAYKDYWHWTDIPLAVKRKVRETVFRTVKRDKAVEARERTYVKGHYRHYSNKK